jgi:hypothetical protein
MCFSAIVSFSTAAGLSLLGLATISQTTTKCEVLLASFPCFFAALLSGFIYFVITDVLPSCDKITSGKS